MTVGGQTATSTANFTVTVPQPTITSFTPTSGQIGTSVTIQGTNFSSVSSDNLVKFNNTIATVTASNNSSITTSVPEGAATGLITVTVGGQTATSNGNFTVPPPTITSLNPASGQIGTPITINGANFSSIAANNIVKFNGIVASVSASTVSSITTVVPIGATNGSVTVTIGGQTGTSPAIFTIPAPTITAFTPTSGPIGTTVTINGSNFSPIVANNQVKFNNVIATVTASTSTSITATAPAAATTGTISVTIGVQTGTSVSSFTIPVPTITSFSPTSGQVGTSVTITGTNFSPVATNNLVKFNGVEATIISSSVNSISVIVPNGASTGNITIALGNQAITSATPFTIPVPTITGFTPANAQIGTSVTITGTNFSPVMENNVVKFNGITATVTASNGTSITVIVPDGASTGNITVTIGGQSVTGATAFTIPAPTITSFSPTIGTIGTVVTITGTNFSPVPASNIVKFNNTTAVVTAITGTTITTTVPEGASSGAITLTLGVNTASGPTNFTVLVPTITSFTPTSGTQGTSVTITGTNFSTTPANNVVKFSGTTANVTSSTATSIVTAVPVDAVTGPITVTVGGSTATSATDFNISLPTPTITGFTPANGQIGTVVTITGTNFNAIPANNIVKFNGTLATVTASTATSITTAIPAGATTGSITVTIGNQTATSSSPINVTSPAIISFSPTNGTVGTSVTISGVNFSTSAANTIVKFNGTVASITGTPTATSIITTVPAGSTSGKISIEIGGVVVSSLTDFTVTTTPAPTITSISPASGAVGATVTITGTNFSTTAANNLIKFNGTVSAVTGTPTATTITTTVPTGATNGKITVEVGGQTATSPIDFTVLNCVLPPKPTITATKLNTESPLLTSSATVGNQWFMNGAAITGANGFSFNVTVPGVYKVQVSVAGCLSDFSNDFAIIVTGDLNPGQSGVLKYYPNPAENTLTIELPEKGSKAIRIFNMNGSMIESFHSEYERIEISVKEYSSGMHYFIITSEKRTVIGKFFKIN